ncbi:hypothetical protein OPV22_002614 [Ensete ventricosum]|uniref:Uncharacterized protein n=1 Tax=Ensete ventricosum TaxID=4639 RepID=A0AAV8RYH2_ENSVE|nr:hypothetical protein OPV22_002614 [Ensete ventricosum]
MIVIRSFDVNKPGSEVDEIKGGVASGSILRGVLKMNQFIEVQPGIVNKDQSGNIKCTPYTRGLFHYMMNKMSCNLLYLGPGGLIGVGTTMDSTLTRAVGWFGQCAQVKGRRLLLSLRVEKHCRLVGWGQTEAGVTLQIPP